MASGAWEIRIEGPSSRTARAKWGNRFFPVQVDAEADRQAWSDTRKVTVEIPATLLEKAQEASGAGITQTVRTGLQLLVNER
jgi:hypothetical protein